MGKTKDAHNMLRSASYDAASALYMLAGRPEILAGIRVLDSDAADEITRLTGVWAEARNRFNKRMAKEKK